jgi:hypothetical protein
MTTCNRRLRIAARTGPLAALLYVRVAFAQGDQASARPLFEEGRRLMTSGQYAEACPKLEAASKLYAGPGVLLNLGDCYEHVGLTASAWAAFGEAVTAAEQAGRIDDEAEAKRRRALVEPHLSRLVIHVAKEAPGLVVKRDGVVVDRATWSVAVAVDPGSHVVRAEAEGQPPWSSPVSVAGEGATVTVDVPDLTAPAVAPPPLTPPAVAGPSSDLTTATPPEDTGHGRRVLGLVVGSAGLASLAVGGIFGGLTFSSWGNANRECPSHSGCSTQAANDRSNALTFGAVSTVGFIAGGLLVAGGVTLYCTAPSGSTPSVGVQLAPGGFGVAGRF